MRSLSPVVTVAVGSCIAVAARLFVVWWWFEHAVVAVFDHGGHVWYAAVADLHFAAVEDG